MRVIQLDAHSWATFDDFYDAILFALDAPHWHGRNVNALHDSIAIGGINGVEPPYKIWIVGTTGLPVKIKQSIEWMVDGVNKMQGKERDVLFQIDP